MRISVIVAAYNIKNYIAKSIESILAQKSSCEIEIIIVDDGSTDGTAEEVEKYKNQSRVKIIHKENGGLSSARNAGIDVATGDYVMFLDGDDYLVDGAIQRLVNTIIKLDGQFDFIQYKYIEVEDYNITTPVLDDVHNYEVVYSKYEVFRRKLSLGGIGASACTKLIRRSVLSHTRFKEGIIHEDEYFTTNLIDGLCHGVVYLDAELYCYVMRQGSIIKSRFSQKRLDIIPVMNKQIGVLNANGFTDLARKVRSNYFGYLCTLYAEARSAKDKASAQKIKNTLKDLIASGPLDLSVKYKTIAQGIKFGLPVLSWYYIYKRINGKTAECHN